MPQLLSLLSGIGNHNPSRQEDKICVQIANELKVRALEHRDVVFFHVPNECNGGSRFGKSLNSIGRIAGAPDFVILRKDKAMLVEVKTKDGTLSKNQKMFNSWCVGAGVKYVVVRSFPLFLDRLSQFLLDE